MLGKNKIGFLGLLTVLTLLTSFAIAADSTVIDISSVNAPSNVNEGDSSFTFTFTLEYSGSSENMDISFADSTTSIGTISIPTETGLNGSIDETRSVTGTISGISNQGGNTATIVINASTSSTYDDITTFNVQINEEIEMCEFGEQGDLEISDLNIDNFGEGSDDEWEILDGIKIEVEVENTDNNDEVDDVMVEIFIFDENDNDVTSEFDFDDEEIDLGDINDDDTEIATFEFEEVPADLDEGDYRIYFKAYSDNKEDEHCVSESNELSEDDYHLIEIVREEDEAVIVRRQDLDETILAACGDSDVRIEFPVYNIGTDKEDGVLVNIYNGDLGIDEYQFIDGLRSGKKEDVTFFVNIPAQLAAENYKLKVFTYYDYDEDEDELKESSYDQNSLDDLDKSWTMDVEIIGCRSLEPSITALLDSAAKVGEELVIKTTIANKGSANTFQVSVSGIEDWAEIVSITPQILTLGDMESTEVEVKLNPTTEGFHTFSINTLSEGETYSQPVSVNIAEGDGIFANSLFDFDDEKTIYSIIGALVILIIIILLLIIIKLSRRKPKERF